MHITSGSTPICFHSLPEHLLRHPLCEQSPLRKVVDLALNFFTNRPPFTTPLITQLQSPFAGRDIASPSVHVAISGELVTEEFISLISADNTPERPYSEIGKEALEFAKQALREHFDTQAMLLPHFRFQLANRSIVFLAALLNNHYYPSLIAELQKNPSYASQEAKDISDKILKIAYTISALTLDEIPSIQQKMQAVGLNKNFAGVLADQNSCLYKTFFYFTVYYHRIRGESLPQARRMVPINSKEHAEKFYKEGTQEYSWRQLYNDCCDRLRLYIPNGQDLRHADYDCDRFLNWTRKDMGFDSFEPVPDTLPT